MPTSAKTRLNNPFIFLGYLLVLFGGILLFRLSWAPVKEEVKYAIDRSGIAGPSPLPPPNHNFALVIDKIGAAAPIFANISPTNSSEYQQALTKGVAHASGTSFPGAGGNIFIFAHSSANPLIASRFNSVFYLMHYLEPSDNIKLWYQDKEYLYQVTSKYIVSPTDTQYLTSHGEAETLTLMTCWPPGTTFKRLIIIAKPI